MEHVAGEGRPRPLLNDDRFEGARAVLVAEVAETAARLHALPAPDDFPKRYPLAEGAASSPTPAGQALADLEALLDDTAEPHPAVELGLRWLHHHLPAPAPWSIVHGDLRLSNLIVGEEGLRALVDWEAAHAGDGAEDLGWMCIRSWRFGRDQLPALGCGTREELLAAYVAGGGRTITPEELRWWEVCGNARWAVICLAQARAVHGGAPPDLEHAMIGRRACEAEWDLLQLLSDARPLPPPVSAPQDAPDAAQLLALVASYLHDEIRPAAPSGHRFRLLVAANACSVVTRELASDSRRRTRPAPAAQPPWPQSCGPATTTTGSKSSSIRSAPRRGGGWPWHIPAGTPADRSARLEAVSWTSGAGGRVVEEPRTRFAADPALVSHPAQ